MKIEKGSALGYEYTAHLTGDELRTLSLILGATSPDKVDSLVKREGWEPESFVEDGGWEMYNEMEDALNADGN